MMRFLLFAIITGLAAAQSGRSARGVNVKNAWVVDKQYTFQKNSYWNFSSMANMAIGQVPSGLKASNYPVDTYFFSPANVLVKDGYLQLWVKNKSFRSGEVTVLQKVKYASVRTVAILSEPAGVCNGMFFYQSDTQETDIEFLSNAKSASNTDATSDANAKSNTRWLWLSNQASSYTGTKTTQPVALPANPTTTEHEYRLDWLPGVTKFYVDGVLVWSSTKNVPSVAGTWVFNNWADGDTDWSAGPPATDAVFKIKEIDMYYNTS
ncbi:glycoside hydrolase family 16 protein [Colletotrichum karsti]|uniref:Glycoside hydrolase family 16 protein n=1 Tax=Colletotrichum karsti TaxID=1095194 RepID=A0A9P6IE87_9PEZI|nr:glycoside hydrolase family 16 protein [Colletotrichum karsti]KAF9880824.1 glycoside hydrolase family 16 protein [Colletotrichum karsti]